jgi:hypothetical protein
LIINESDVAQEKCDMNPRIAAIEAWQSRWFVVTVLIPASKVPP